MSAAGEARRVQSVDVLRGLVMVLMALDHVRDYVTNLRVQPEQLAQHGSAALFATRWVTHICAPTFALLAGLGIGLAMNRGRSPGAMSRYLVTRGLWLIVLDLVITPIGWRFNLELLPAFALVLWALGLSMIVMAVLIHLPRGVVAGGALLTIATHNLFDAVQPAAWGALAPLWHVLHVPGFAVSGTLFVAYPLIPWVAVMAFGWTLAATYSWEPTRRRSLLMRAGVAATVAFIAIRLVNGYGDPRAWAEHSSLALTIASFLNATKYPPSLDFLLMTLGPALVALALLEHARGKLARWLAVFGSVPLFYYVVHIPVVHLAGVVLALVQGGALRRIPVTTDPSSLPAWYGVGLPGVYVAWTLVVLAMYPISRWYAERERRRSASAPNS